MRKYRISIIATIIAVLITSYLALIYFGLSSSTGPFPMGSYISYPENDTSFNNLFSSAYVNDSLPHYEYRRIEDSLKQIRSTEELDNKSGGSGQRFGSVGFYSITKNRNPLYYNLNKEDPELKRMSDSLDIVGKKFINVTDKDSISKIKEELGNITWRINVRSNELTRERQKKEQKLYYLGLEGYQLHYDSEFFVQNGNYYITVVKWDTVIKRKYDSTKVGHYERKEIAVRYSKDDERILVPISKKKYDFFKTALAAFIFISIFFLIYIFIGLPIQILIDISKGKAFTKENIRRFKLMAYVLFVCTFLKVFSPYILNLFYRKIIPKEFQLEPVISATINNIYLFLIALVLFFVGKAFQKGYNLQQEQDLTI
ncbi:MAG TPA: DUF2975 domain-containing protein [Chitinophagaceae bacterium]|jgi:hypothetical protein|nr:DUF2975 domain-containing protein [Chitinophagaceae bacterium]